jgi:hypothetical protein
MSYFDHRFGETSKGNLKVLQPFKGALVSITAERGKTVLVSIPALQFQALAIAFLASNGFTVTSPEDSKPT